MGIVNATSAGGSLRSPPSHYPSWARDGHELITPQLAADQGDAAAQNNLGGMYANGWGVEQDYGEAVRLFRLATDQENAKAQYNLGIMYSDGLGVPRDYVSAHKWLNLAAAQGHENARQRRDAAAREMSAEQLIEAQQAARATRSIPPEG